MKIKNDYYQSVPKVRICTIQGDEHIEVWWNVKNLDGDVYPVELQMSIRGAAELSANINKAICMLIDSKKEQS